MKYLATLAFLLSFGAYSGLSSSAELKQRTGIIKEIRKDHIVLDNASGTQSHIGFVCDPEICNLTTEYSAGDEVLAIFDSVKRVGSDGRINKLISIRKCLDNDADCIKVAEEDIKANELSEIESNKFLKILSACQKRMNQDLETDSRYIADTWVTRIRRLTIDRNVDYDDLNEDESTAQCVDKIFQNQHDAVVEICEKHGCGDRIGGGCEHIAGYSGTDAVDIHAIKQCMMK